LTSLTVISVRSTSPLSIRRQGSTRSSRRLRRCWPACGERLLDPGAGNGGFVVAALRRLDLDVNDVAGTVDRVRGYEFCPGAVAEARDAVRGHLAGCGWSAAAACSTAELVIEERDFLLDLIPAGEFDVIAANPPYWRLANLPPGYRVDYELAVERHARADLLYAYLQRSADVLAAGGKIGLITADRWLRNQGSAKLREQLGRRFRVTDIHRLDGRSVFYRPKQRRKGTPPRVHPVSLILTTGLDGRLLDASPFQNHPGPRHRRCPPEGHRRDPARTVAGPGRRVHCRPRFGAAT